LYTDVDICAWLLANQGKDPLDLIVLEKHQGTDEGRAKRPAPVSGHHQFSHPNLWHRIGSAENVNQDIDMEGNGTDDSDNYNNRHFDDTIIIDKRWRQLSQLPLTPGVGKLMMKYYLFFRFYSFNPRPVRFIIIIYNYQC